MLFGCDPASGVPADTKLVQVLVQHLRDYFDPEDGSARLPDCLGLIDAIESDVALESTSCNLGRALNLKRQDNRVRRKQIIVITQDAKSNEGEVAKVSGQVKKRTQMVIDFFTTKLKFKPNELIYFTETEIRSLVKLLDQSQIFKHYN